MYTQSSNFICREEADGKYLFYNTETDEIFFLNSVGYSIYQEMIAGKDTDEIIRAVCQRTGDNEATAADIIKDLMGILLQKGIVVL